MPKASVLVVDDSQLARREVVSALGQEYDVSEAEHGAAGLSAARQRRFDVVLTDVNMPVMGGIELTRLLRALPDYASTPIFAITTESSPDLVDRGRAAGVTAWVVKPINPTTLARAVETVLARQAAG